MTVLLILTTVLTAVAMTDAVTIHFLLIQHILFCYTFLPVTVLPSFSLVLPVLFWYLIIHFSLLVLTLHKVAHAWGSVGKHCLFSMNTKIHSIFFSFSL